MSVILALAYAGSAAAQGQALSCANGLVGGVTIDCHATGSARAQLRAGTFIAGSESAGETLAQAIALEIATAPFGSSSGGFTFTFQPDARAWRRTADTFGPAFAERALTIGRHKFAAGFNYLHRSYDNFDNFELKNLDIFQFRGGTLPVSLSTFTLGIQSDTLATFAHYGVLDKVDVGVLVPFIQLRLDGGSQIFDPQGRQVQHVALNSSSTGVGDVAVFGKYRFWHFGPDPTAADAKPNGAAALAATIRLPTGNEDDLLGLGVTRSLVTLVASATTGRFAPHANIGYEFWSSGIAIPRDFQGLATVTAKDRLDYIAGVEYEVHPRLTVLGDVLGSYVRGAGSVGYQDYVFPANQSNVQGAMALVAVPDGVNSVLVAPGMKWNFFRSSLLTVNVLVPTTRAGLWDRITPVVGIDWAF